MQCFSQSSTVSSRARIGQEIRVEASDNEQNDTPKRMSWSATQSKECDAVQCNRCDVMQCYAMTTIGEDEDCTALCCKRKNTEQSRAVGYVSKADGQWLKPTTQILSP